MHFLTRSYKNSCRNFARVVIFVTWGDLCFNMKAFVRTSVLRFYYHEVNFSFMTKFAIEKSCSLKFILVVKNGLIFNDLPLKMPMFNCLFFRIGISYTTSEESKLFSGTYIGCPNSMPFSCPMMLSGFSPIHWHYHTVIFESLLHVFHYLRTWNSN